MKLKRKIGKQLLSGILAFGLALSSAMTGYAYTADTQILPAVSEPAADCVLVGVKGDYISEAKEALARINEIRLEACKEGIFDPRKPSRNLTEADYVEIKWSAELEKAARIRAAEASLVTSHTRPNGESPFSIGRIGASAGEVLAWNQSLSMIPGIEQWYGEKGDWVSQNSNRVTGHYTSMINPSNTYVGIGCMVTDYGLYRNTTCGRFSSTSAALDETMAAGVSGCIQVIEIKKSALTQASLTKVSNSNSSNSRSSSNLKVGDAVSYELTIGTDLEGMKAKVLLMDTVTWSSSDSAVATVDNYGNVTCVGAGSATITATSDSGFNASVSLTITGKSNKDGDKTANSSTVPKVKSLKAKAGARKLTITWKKVSGAAGYELQVGKTAIFSGAQTVRISKSKKQYVAKKLQAKKKYYVRIRAYKTYTDDDGRTQKAYGAWAKVSKKTK